jgi:hypothetical protein
LAEAEGKNIISWKANRRKNIPAFSEISVGHFYAGTVGRMDTKPPGPAMPMKTFKHVTIRHVASLTWVTRLCI